ncbi:hypothetical protein HTV80_33710 [Streptomyces sp. Vc74B-19]|uniref:hypothetical protein n=1 Tax=unclassified Streptomyces TaxID=2593676 RepID=UPI001BFCCEEB|nr:MULTISPECIES: hypothetical protein [unclassified Streptomyces]MBT3168008.1 hypothetical protein [Streptomyces sp. Vc74B-19]MCO4697977.1 hypothetical protein [Streptomyces sp. RO-S4]MDU0303098.1 hypothetical protein [Streptomyces sp. PAL114]
MKSEDTPFEGGPMDGRVLPVLLGITGHPPKTYRIPVPAPDGGPPTVLVYRRVPRGTGRLTGLTARWKYLYDPTGRAGDGGPRWPWRKSRPAPDATPQGKPDDAHG